MDDNFVTTDPATIVSFKLLMNIFKFVYVESFCAIFMDIYPRLRNFHKYSREIFLAVCNVGFCSLGMIFMTEVITPKLKSF